MVSAGSCLTGRNISLSNATHSIKCVFIVLFCFWRWFLQYHLEDLITECLPLDRCVWGSSGRMLRTWKWLSNVCHLFYCCVPLPYQNLNMPATLAMTSLSCKEDGMEWYITSSMSDGKNKTVTQSVNLLIYFHPRMFGISWRHFTYFHSTSGNCWVTFSQVETCLSLVSSDHPPSVPCNCRPLLQDRRVVLFGT